MTQVDPLFPTIFNVVVDALVRQWVTVMVDGSEERGNCGQKANFRKTVGMFCRSCQAVGTQLEAAYRKQMTGEGPSYHERQKVQVQCREFGEDMVA